MPEKTTKKQTFLELKFDTQTEGLSILTHWYFLREGMRRRPPPPPIFCLHSKTVGFFFVGGLPFYMQDYKFGDITKSLLRRLGDQIPSLKLT